MSINPDAYACWTGVGSGIGSGACCISSGEPPTSARVVGSGCIAGKGAAGAYICCMGDGSRSGCIAGGGAETSISVVAGNDCIGGAIGVGGVGSACAVEEGAGLYCCC